MMNDVWWIFFFENLTIKLVEFSKLFIVNKMFTRNSIAKNTINSIVKNQFSRT